MIYLYSNLKKEDYSSSRNQNQRTCSINSMLIDYFSSFSICQYYWRMKLQDKQQWTSLCNFIHSQESHFQRFIEIYLFCTFSLNTFVLVLFALTTFRLCLWDISSSLYRKRFKVLRKEGFVIRSIYE